MNNLTPRRESELQIAKSHNDILSCIATGIVLAMVFGVRTQAMAQHSTTNEELRQWQIYVGEMERKLHFHTTSHCLERSTVEALDHFQTATEPLDRSVSTVPEFIAELEDKCPQLKVITDDSDKEHLVLHLIDKELAKKCEVLDRKNDFQYSGKVGDIAAALEKQGIPVGPPRSGGYSGGILGSDHVTKVTIDVKQKSIRDILTHCVDLDDYKRTVWTAETLQAEDGTWKMQIRFMGPRSR